MLNKTGKTLTIFIILTIVLLLSSTSIGFYLYHLEERKYKVLEGELDSSHANEAKLQGQIKDLQGTVALEQDKNKEDDKKINSLLDEQDLNEGLRTALKKENAGLKDQIDNLNQAKEKLKSDLDDATTKLSQYQSLLKVSENKSNELETRINGLEASNKQLVDKFDEMRNGPGERIVKENVPQGGVAKGTMELDKIVVNPQDPNQGHVLNVDTEAEFVIFNLGMQQGIKPNDVLSVYRGNQYLGDVKAIRVQDEMSAADIIPPLSAKNIQKDDIVVLKP